MPISQAISPATAGDQLKVGDPVLLGDGTLMVRATGVSGGPANRLFVTLDQVQQPYHTLTDSRCLDGYTASVLSGIPVVPVSAADTSEIGGWWIRNNQRSLLVAGAVHTKTGTQVVNWYSIAPNIEVQVCSSQLNGILYNPLGLPVSLTQVAVVETPLFGGYGDLKSIIQQFVNPFGETHDHISGLRFVSSVMVYLPLSVEDCGGSYYTSDINNTPKLRRVLALGKDHLEVGDLRVDNYITYVSPIGWKDTHLGKCGYVVYRQRVVLPYLRDVFCVLPGTAVQSSMGLTRGALPQGLHTLGIGDHDFFQGPPKILASANDQLSIGNWSYLLPDPTVAIPGSVLSLGIGLHQVVNQREVITFSGVAGGQVPAVVVTPRDPPRPLGTTHSDYGTLFISHWRRFYGPFITGDTSNISTSAWVSHHTREIFPDSETFSGVGQGLVEKRVFTVGHTFDPGTAFIYNLNKYAGPMGAGTTDDLAQNHILEYGTRYLSDFGPLQQHIGNAQAYLYTRYLTPYTNTLSEASFGQAYVHNANVPVFPVQYDATEIPYTHLVHRNPYQQLHQGSIHTLFGDTNLELSIRRVYPGVVSHTEVFNPGMTVERQIVIATTGHRFDGYGTASVELLDLYYQMSQYESFEPGQALVSFLNRSRQMYGDAFLGLGTPFVWNKHEFITLAGQDHFVQPYATTYVDEHFSIIGPSIITSTKYGAAFLENLNKEYLVAGGDLSGIPITHEVSLFNRAIYPAGVTSEFGTADIKDSLQWVYFPNPTNHTFIGHPNIYLGQPWLPSNQTIYPPSIARHTSLGSQQEVDSYWIGHHGYSTNPQEVFFSGETLTLGPGSASLQSLGIKFSLQGTYFKSGIPTILGGVGDTIVFSGPTEPDDPGYFLSGNATVRPNWVYMTNDAPSPSPYPDTTAWYPPDTSFANPPERRYKIGYLEVQNFNREIRMSGEYHTRIPYYHIVSQITPDIIAPAGVRPFMSPMFMLLGGIREVSFDTLNLGYDGYVSGDHNVALPTGPYHQTASFSGQGYLATEFGETLVENFIRYLTITGGLNTFEAGTAWVSRSPRFLNMDSVVGHTMYGGTWVSFVIRHVLPEGAETSVTKTYSNTNYNARTKVYRTPPVDVVRVHPYDTDMSEVGDWYIKRGGACE